MTDPKYTMQVPENMPQWLVDQQLARIAEEVGCEPGEIAVEVWALPPKGTSADV